FLVSPDSWQHSLPVFLHPAYLSRRLILLMGHRLASGLLCSKVHCARPSFFVHAYLVTHVQLRSKWTSFDADSQAGYAALCMETSAQSANGGAETIHRDSVSELKQEGGKTVCCFNNIDSILISNFLGAHIRPSDEVEFPLAINSACAGRELYQAPISYATQPKTDKREHLYVRAAVSSGHLGIGTIHLPCEMVRDYFYVATRHQAWERQANLYDTLRISATASPAELRLAFKLRELELRAAGGSKRDHATLERTFNILAQRELRACYDSLLKDSSSPALFPYGGFGSILVAGDRAQDG